MLTTHDENKHFEIFSAPEMELLNGIEDTEFKKNIHNMAKNMNTGMNNLYGGWYGQLKEKLAGAEIKQKEQVEESINTYLRATNRLQQPKEGEFKKATLGGKFTIETHVNIYNAFWEDCIEATLHAYLSLTSKMTTEYFAADGKDKSHVFVLSLLKSNQYLKELVPHKLERFYKTIDQVIENIKSRTGLQGTFILNEIESECAREFFNNLFRKIKQIILLKKFFESEKIYARYIHVRPDILIQYIQVLDYIIAQSKDYLKNSAFFEFKSKNLTTPHPLIEMLKQKKLEMVEMLYFHEKLWITFGRDDFMEVLNHLVKNINSGILPNHTLFEFCKMVKVKIFTYDEKDPARPSDVPMDGLSEWRTEYLQKLNPLRCIEALEKPFSPEVKEEKQKLINVVKVNVLWDFKSYQIFVPSIVAEGLRNAFNRQQTHPSDLLLLGNFFMLNAMQREKIHKLNEYKTSFDFLKKQMNYNAQLSFFSNTKDGKSFQCNEGTEKHVKQILGILEILTQLIPDEVEIIKEVQNKSQHLKMLYQTYRDMLIGTQTLYLSQMKKILTFWIYQIESRHFNTFVLFSNNSVSLLSNFDEAITMMRDPALNALWDPTKKELLSRIALKLLAKPEFSLK